MKKFATNRRDPLILIAVLALCASVIGTAWLLGRTADSAGVASNVDNVDPVQYTASEFCQNWATFWMTDSGLGVPAQALESFSYCRQTADGSWVYPENASDPRLARPVIFSTAEQEQIGGLRTQIQSAISRFQYLESAKLKTSIDKLYDPNVNGADGHLLDGAGIGGTRKLYQAEFEEFLATPGAGQLAAYVEWAVEYRKAAFAQLTALCNTDEFQYFQNACRGTGDAFSINYYPWTWDLNDSLLLDTYLRAVLDGTAPVPPGYIPAA
jgi:hypothetical protein